eukprot:CAMPEP_0119546868 /NCGR_PEP_ID=MMETSP1352-20130426/1112_1 /TAXON_ID=265584 /ORGANISM="Stauroneis constricta, Strain CCMP1120" /LENGTH=142 /DNA_ID=CAMNT_0007591611 /DNA_START=102 /DNA_END=530 /DNA_ORIENTATION=-
MGVLTVFLDKITNLRDADTFGKSDPYVIFELEQDGWIYDKTLDTQKSSKKKNELNPEYGETFTFKKVPTIDNMTLHVKVKDDDFGFDDDLGGCDINLEKLDDLFDGVDVEKVVDAKKGGGWFSRKAKIYLTIKYSEDDEVEE